MISRNISVVLSFKSSPGPRLEFPAIVAWVLPDGVAWMQPGYLDPYGATSPQFHLERGTLSYVGQAGYIAVLENDLLTAYLRPADDATSPDVLNAFTWYEQQLAERGLGRQAEAEALQEELADTLGYSKDSPSDFDG